MKFSELEALVKDDIPKADKKAILRRLKRVLGQVNSLIQGLLKTVQAVDLTSEINYTVSGQIDGGSPPSGEIDTGSVYIVTTTGGAYTEKELWEFNGTIWVNIVLVDKDRIMLTEDLTGGNISFSMKYVYEWDTDTSDWLSITYITDGFSYSNGTLTLHKDIKQTITVLVDGLPWTRKTAGYVKANANEKIYWFSQYNELIFAETAIAAATDKIEIYGLYKIPIPSTTTADTLIDVPEDWEEGIISGVIFYLTIGKYRDEDLKKINSLIFDRMIQTISTLELNRHPVEEVEQGFTGYR